MGGRGEYLIGEHAQVSGDVERILVRCTLGYACVVELAHDCALREGVPVLAARAGPGSVEQLVPGDVGCALNPVLVAQIPQGILVAHLTELCGRVIQIVLSGAERRRRNKIFERAAWWLEQIVHNRKRAKQKHKKKDQVLVAPRSQATDKIRKVLGEEVREGFADRTREPIPTGATFLVLLLNRVSQLAKPPAGNERSALAC